MGRSGCDRNLTHQSTDVEQQAHTTATAVMVDGRMVNKSWEAPEPLHEPDLSGGGLNRKGSPWPASGVRRRLVVARVVGDGEAVVGGVRLDRVGDSGLGERLLEEVLLLIGKRLVLDRPGHVDGGPDGGRFVVGAVGVVLLGDVPAVEGGGRRDRVRPDSRP